MNHCPLRRAIRIALLGMTTLAVVPAYAQKPVAGTSPPAEGAVEQPADEQATLTEGAAGEDTLGEVVVTARQRSAAEEVLQERIEQPVVADLVSADQISRVGDSTVSLALRRLPGVTLVADQFVYIRGLGERYSSTTLNGAYVPSPDLTRNVIPLDLFPANIVQSLSVQKGFTPDKPAAFGGGNVDIRTRTIPEEFTFGVQVGSGWSSESSDDGLTYAGGGNDRWGEDDGSRALPADITAAIQEYRGRLGVNDIFGALVARGGIRTVAEAQAINRNLAVALNRDVEPTAKSLSPDVSAEVNLGNSWNFGPDDNLRFGFLALGDYGNEWRNRVRTVRSAGTPDVDVDVQNRTTHQVSVTGSLAMGLDFAEEQTVGATVLYLRNTEDDASITLGNNQNFLRSAGEQLRAYRTRFEQRALTSVQLRGAHTLGPATRALLEERGHGWLPLDLLEGLRFEWYWADSRATTDVPNETTISARDRIDPSTGALISTGLRQSASAAEFRFTDLSDDVLSTGWKLGRAFEFGDFVLELSGGQDYYEKGRGYLQTQLNLGSTVATTALLGTPSTVLADANILNPANGFGLSIGGIGTESYLAGETIEAGFGQFDLKIGDSWRVSGGVRWEDFVRASVPVDQFQFDTSVGKIPVPADQLSSLVTAEDDYYPALALTYIRPGFWADDFQLRFGWSQTVARPDLREVSASTFIDPLTEARVRGNPGLVTANLSNFDLRGEWFFSGGDNFTVSLFYKDIESPIETVEAAGTDDNIALTFVNADSAEIYGVEFEALKSLGFLSGNTWSEPFFVQGNVTISDSTLTVGSGTGLNLTNNERRLTQHSPLVANVQLGFDAPNGRHSATLVYSFFDERVFYAGRGGAPDALEAAFNSLDLNYSWFPIEPLSVKLRIQNLLDEQTVIEQGGVEVLEQTIGTTFKLDLTYRF